MDNFELFSGEKPMTQTRAYLQTLTNKKIDNNYLLLRRETERIKNRCIDLNMNPIQYAFLPQIEKGHNLESWMEFGKTLVDKLSSKEIGLNLYSTEIAESYLNLSEIVGYNPLRKVAHELAKTILKISV